MTMTAYEKVYYKELAQKYLESGGLTVEEHTEYGSTVDDAGITTCLATQDQPITWDVYYPNGDAKTCTFKMAVKSARGRDNSFRVTSHKSPIIPDFFLVYISELRTFITLPGDYFVSIVERDREGKPVLRGGRPVYIRQVGATRNLPAAEIEAIRRTKDRKLWE